MKLKTFAVTPFVYPWYVTLAWNKKCVVDYSHNVTHTHTAELHDVHVSAVSDAVWLVTDLVDNTRNIDAANTIINHLNVWQYLLGLNGRTI